MIAKFYERHSSDNAREMKELVQEVREELPKPLPNWKRVAGAASALAHTIHTTAALQPAYLTLKSILLHFGVHLPF